MYPYQIMTFILFSIKFIIPSNNEIKCFPWDLFAFLDVMTYCKRKIFVQHSFYQSLIISNKSTLTIFILHNEHVPSNTFLGLLTPFILHCSF